MHHHLITPEMMKIVDELYIALLHPMCQQLFASPQSKEGLAWGHVVSNWMSEVSKKWIPLVKAALGACNSGEDRVILKSMVCKLEQLDITSAPVVAPWAIDMMMDSIAAKH